MVAAPGHQTSNKIDFVLNLTCSTFVAPIPLSHDEFAAILGGGELGAPQSTGAINTTLPALAALDVITKALHVGCK